MKTYKHKYWKRVCLFLLLVACCSIVQAQSTLVLNGGITVLNGGAAGSPVYLVVNESNPAGITRLSGHIHSENQYNFVKWISGTGTGNYIFPFGVAGNAADYIPFTFNKTTAGSSDIDMATWTTDILNIPHAAATNVGPVTNMTGTADSVLYAIDRFWDIQTSAAVTADLTFSYLGIENTTSSPTDTVKAQHWNGSSWDAQVGPGNLGVVAGVGSAGPFLGQTTFSPWILSIFSPCPSAVISYPSDYCDNDTTPQAITFSGDTGGIFSASPAGLAIDTLTGTVIPSNSTPATYVVTYTIDSTATCPIFTTTTNITINPTFNIALNDTICQGDTIIIAGIPQTTAGVYNEILATVLGCDSIISTTLFITPTNTTQLTETICQGDTILIAGIPQTVAGIYNDTIQTTLSCDSIIETTLTVNPVITTQTTDSICQGESILLGGALQTVAGTYYDTLQTTLSCDSIVETTLTVNPLPNIIADTSTTICAGTSANLTAIGGNTYVWDNGIGAGQNQIVSPIVTTTYIVTGTDLNNCSDTSSVIITVTSSTLADAGIDQELCDDILAFTLNGNTPLIAGEIGIWTTTSSGIITTPTTPVTTGTGLSLGSNIFAWTIINAICPPSIDYVTINVVGCEPSVLIIPNVFTPNGDASNDVFTVEGVNLESVQGEIYNRWGQKMFAWDNINGYWDGRTTAGIEAPDGTYFYIITALGQDGIEYFKKGAFSLIR
jgi:gliding motility-associated-like protein